MKWLKWKPVTEKDCTEGMGLEKYNKLMTAHCEEAATQGADFHNLGWAVTGYGIASKTSQGVLDSEIADDGKITHQWS